MHFEQYDYTIGTHYISAIINGDTSGLNDDEEQMLNDFLSCDVFQNGHWAVPDNDESFSRCDISGLMGDCSDMTFFKAI